MAHSGGVIEYKSCIIEISPRHWKHDSLSCTKTSEGKCEKGLTTNEESILNILRPHITNLEELVYISLHSSTPVVTE